MQDAKVAAGGRRRLGELLIEAGAIDEAQLLAALGEQKKWGGRIGRLVVSLGFCPETAVVAALSRQLGVPIVRLESVNPDAEVLKMLPGDFCQKQRVLPFAFHAAGRLLDVAMADPMNLPVVDEIRIRSRANPRPHVAGEDEIDMAIQMHYLRDPLSDPKLRPARVTDPWGLTVDLSTSRPERAAAGAQSGAALGALAAALEARCDRNERVLRTLLRLVVEKGLITKAEIKKRLQED